MTNDLSPASAPHLFSPLTIRGVTFRNRIVVSPMCQYSAVDGMATDWHLVHLGSRAVGQAAAVLVEATAVQAIGRISPEDMGIWDDRHVEPLARCARFIAEQGVIAGIQLAHAGRKACTRRPWDGGKPLTEAEGAWTPVGPSRLAFAPGYPLPQELDAEGIRTVVNCFVEGARRAIHAGFRLIEIHSAHGYLLHSFLSPLSNERTDEYGGSLANRMRLLLETVEAVRRQIPDSTPLFVRISATDWADDGWDLEQSVALARALSTRGVDLIDCSSGALVAYAKVPVGKNYQVPFAERIRAEVGIMTGAVGMITEPRQADEIISSGRADIVLLAREMLRDPYWPLHAAKALGHEIAWPVQYARARN